MEETTQFKRDRDMVLLTKNLVARLDQLNEDYPLAHDWRELITLEVIEDEILCHFEDVEFCTHANSGYAPCYSQRQARVLEGNDFDDWLTQRGEELADKLIEDGASSWTRGQSEAVFELGVRAIYRNLKRKRQRQLDARAQKTESEGEAEQVI